MTSPYRYEARLRTLSPDELFELAVKGCEESSAVRARAEALLASHAPPEEMRERAGSSDLAIKRSSDRLMVG